MAEVLLKCISKRLGATSIIDCLTLDIGNGEFITLLGPSGCGKTTLLKMIAGLETIDKGDLYIGGKRYNDLPAQNRKLAMVFQSYALFPHMSVAQNVKFGLSINKVPAETSRKKLSWAIDMFELSGLEDRLPREISGGQRQRVALARALVLDPDVLLLDEPLSNLDAALRETAMEELKRIHSQVGTTIIYVTHNQVEAMTMSQRIAVLSKGRLEQYDTPRTVYDSPATRFSASFIGSPAMNFFAGKVEVHGEDAGVVTPVGFIKLDKERFAPLQAMTGRPVTVGIRPQNIAYAEHHESKRYSDTMLSVSVELIETLGDRSLVVSRGENGTPLRFLITRDIAIEPQEMVDVFVDGRRVHLFDLDTDKNVFYS
jgi:multiple sugar transport system ATP-binding protein